MWDTRQSLARYVAFYNGNIAIKPWGTVHPRQSIMADKEALPCLGKTYSIDALEANLFRPKEGG
jgi:hypothetical protein